MKNVLNAIATCLVRFGSDKRGNIAILFGLSSTALVVAAGAGIDLSHAYTARQKLSEVGALTCQYSVRPSIIETGSSTSTATGGFTTYVNAVNTYAANTLSRVNWNGPAPTPANGYFTATAPVAGAVGTTASTSPTSPVVEMTASVPTYFMQIVHIPQITVHTKINCLTGPNAPQIVTQPPNVQEGFENVTCPGYCFILPNGTYGAQANPTSSTPSSPSYIGVSGQQWYILGYCLEVDTTGVINSTSPEGTHTAELDCDNGNGSAGNSSITTKTYLSPGYYELRYNYRSRVDYPNYDPTYICGSTASDVSWANDTKTNMGSAALRTNQINVYLDIASTASIPTHATMDGTEQLGGVNLIDMCVYSPNWIERSVKIRVTTPGYYWLSFAADGANDSYGGQLDNIRVCQNVCAGTPQDNFPWLTGSNGVSNKLLFEDTFENPSYSQNSKNGNLSNSKGTTGSASSGWPSQLSSGWATAPYNEVVYWAQGAFQGSQYVSLQGWNPTTSSDISTYGYTNSGDPINRAISRSFLLDPGYYSISYDYVSLVDFSYDFVFNNAYYPICTAYPTTSNNLTYYGMKHGYDYASSTLLSQYLSTNFMNVYMSHGQEISTPIVNTTLGSAPTYNNPDGTVTATPKVPPDGGSIFAAYNPSAVNPVLETCQYSQGYGWKPQSVNVKITKPGWYWLTFSAQGDPLTGAGAGPGIDDVKLTALGSPIWTGAPTSALTTIPTPAPLPDTPYNNSGAFNGFYIVADPFAPTAADL